MFNPFAEIADDSDERELVEQAKQGSREALERLVLRHQAWIYNIAVRMVFHRLSGTLRTSTRYDSAPSSDQRATSLTARSSARVGSSAPGFSDGRLGSWRPSRSKPAASAANSVPTQTR